MPFVKTWTKSWRMRKPRIRGASAYSSSFDGGPHSDHRTVFFLFELGNVGASSGPLFARLALIPSREMRGRERPSLFLAMRTEAADLA